MELARLAAGAELDEIAAVLRADGCVVVEGLALEDVAAAGRELAPHMAAVPFGEGNFHGVCAKNVEGLVGKSAAAHRLMLHPTVLALADRLLLPHCVRYQLNYTGIMHLEPGAKAQELHRDGDLYPFRNPCPPTILAAMWAASDFTGENGATLLVPGSHLWEHERRPVAGEIVAAAMAAGSLLLYLGGLIHGGGANVSRHERRTGIAIQYSLGWLRQEENLHLAVPPALAKTLPDRLARLVGYQFGGPFCGFVNGDDPHRLIEDAPGGPRCHSTPELDRADARLARLRWGDVAPVATPEGRPAAEGGPA